MKYRQIKPYTDLIRLTKPIGFFLLLWPTYWGLWIASKGSPSIKNIIILTAGAFIMRSAGCILNDLTDKKWDSKVTRTKLRPLTSGALSTFKAIVFLFILLMLAFILVYQLGKKAILLGFLGLLLTGLYPFCKRWTYWPQVLLGIVFGGWPILIAFIAEIQTLNAQAYYLFLTASLWPIAYDTFYAMADRDDDKKIGIKSSALYLGNWDCYFTAFIYMIILGLMLPLGQVFAKPFFYYLGMLFATFFVFYQQFLARSREAISCLKAFHISHYFGLSLFLGMLFASIC